MEERRVALLVATDRYQDSGLSRLAAPASDAGQLAAVLGDPIIAGFEITQLVNRPNAEVGRAIGNFYRDRRRDDLTLLYFTGHGIKDDYGQLYLAMTDTDRDNLPFTGVRGEQIRLAMEGCRSRQNVLILDCCYAGAFPAGSGVKGDTAVHALEQLSGRGSVVLTSSDATQYSFEGNELTETGSASLRLGASSLFTRFLVEGLRTGRADLDGDGNITLDELYSYVHDHVTEERPQQRPKKKDDVEGHILFARNIHWALPPHLSGALGSPHAVAKLTALEELRDRYNRGNTIVQQRVLETVRGLVEDDSKPVSEAASQFLSAVIEAGEKARQEAGEKARPRIRIQRWKLVSALLAVTAVLATVFIVISRAPTASATETVTMQQALFSGGQTQSVSASCPAGTQMVGGGFSSDPYVAVYSSYPSGPSTWTIVGGNYGAPQTPVPIIAYATCVQADFSLGLMIASSAVTDVSSGSPANVIASCPANSTVLGGGPQSTYRSRPSQFSDLPIAFSSYSNDLSSWTVGVAAGNLGASVRAYAVCARSHVSAANIVSGPLTVTGMDSTTVQCATGQLLTQGGYYSNASDDRFKPVYSKPEGLAPALWNFEARFAYLGSKIPPSATIYGICVRYS